MARIKGKQTTADYLPINEFYNLVDGLHNNKHYFWELYCRLSFCTALRISDVLSTSWEEVLDKDSFDKIEKKTGKSRTIPLNKSVSLKIRELYELLGKPEINNLIFLNKKTNKPYSKEYINRLLKKFIWDYKLSIKAFSSHTFRKTFGRYVYESSGRSAESLILLNSIFRHTSMEITKIYIGLQQTEINKVFDSIKF